MPAQIMDGTATAEALYDEVAQRAAAFTANAPIAKTLRPVREESVDFDNTKNLFIEGDNGHLRPVGGPRD